MTGKNFDPAEPKREDKSVHQIEELALQRGVPLRLPAHRAMH
jgi:hypothetical protein